MNDPSLTSVEQYGGFLRDHAASGGSVYPYAVGMISGVVTSLHISDARKASEIRSILTALNNVTSEAVDPTGLDYSRPADDPQPSGGREPMHTGAMTERGLVDETNDDPHVLCAEQEHNGYCPRRVLVSDMRRLRGVEIRPWEPVAPLVVDEPRPDPTGLDEVSDADLRETVHWRSSDLPHFVIACGAESGPHSADLLGKVTCRACLAEAPF